MILGKDDVKSALTKIVPHMLKICSYRLESESPSRGETFFNEHSSYKKANEEETREIERCASTYFILTLESIMHWAEWIPVDEFGQ